MRVVTYRGKPVKDKEVIDSERVLLTFKDGSLELVTPQMWQMYKQDRFRFQGVGKNGNKRRRGSSATEGNSEV